MKESGYYPPGAEFDPNAPWNQDDEELDYVEKDVEVCISLSKTVTIETNDYIPTIEEDYDVDIDEDGNRYVTGGTFESQDFSDTDWNKAYREDECNILTLLKEYGEILKQDISAYKDRLGSIKNIHSNNPNVKRKINKLRNKIKLLERKYKACNGYIIDDLEVFEA